MDEERPETLQVGASLGPFIVGRLLGHGGMGIVYEAKHRETGAEVALKTLHRLDNRTTTRLTYEFRNLARLRHPRLVQLYELHTIEDHTFITMERIDGVALDTYLGRVERYSPDYYDALRNCFRQIAEGLLTLHTEGLLHLDLKPDNVLVDSQDRVRILDFGLAAPLESRSEREKTRRIGGTPRYMAPERLELRGETTKTDWYSLGVMLGEELNPNWGGPEEELTFPDLCPEDLSDLARRLIANAPDERPDGQEIAGILGAEPSGTFRTGHSPSGFQLVGRESELSALRAGLLEAESGRAGWYRVAGESGIGKTALVHRFRMELKDDPNVIILGGTCHERESVPFQGLDEIMTGLARALSRTSPRDTELEQQLLAAESLSPAFSDLCRDLPGISPVQHPLQKRREAFSAIKELVSFLCRSHTVVIVLDDIQWGDAGGARLLAEILTSPTPERLMVVTTSRTEERQLPLFVEEAEEVLSLRGTRLVRRNIDLGRLSDEHLKDCLPKRKLPISPSRQKAIVRAAGGLPFLAEALGSHPWRENEAPTLTTVIDGRLDDAPPGARAVMRSIALSPSPVPQAVALELVEDAALRSEVLAALRNAKLVRTSGTTPDAPLEPYHALVARTVQDQLSAREQRQIRLQLAQSLESRNLASAEHLASLFHLAGAETYAAKWAPQAAEEAERSLAFESAAHWYGRSAAWLPGRAQEFLPRKARCLEHAGRSADAAATYEECAQLQESQRAHLIRSAGSAWLSSGHVDKGLLALGPELAALGSPIPTSENRALWKGLLLIWRLSRRGIDFTAASEENCDPQALSRVDAVWHAAKGLGVVRPMSGFALQLDCLAAALETREPQRVARSLGVVGPMLVGTPWEKVGLRWFERAQELSQEAKSEYLNGVLLTFEAVHMTAKWERPQAILERAQQGFDLLQGERGTAVWEQSMAFTAGLRVREQLGRFDELERMSANWLAESTDRGDLFAQAMACQGSAMSHLAKHNISEAREFAWRSVKRWSQATYTVQHCYALRYSVQCDLAEGHYEDAQERLRDSWRALKSAQLLRNPISRPELLLLKGVVELDAARAAGLRRSRIAESLSRTLRRDKSLISQSHGLLLQGACAWLRRPSKVALEPLEVALENYKELGQVLFAACLELTLASASGQDERRLRADKQLRALGVRAPENYARIHVPLLDGSAPPRLPSGKTA